ncbi:hypothetical protein [Nocardia callitridis]|uniref:hypothetical protein n=1 Tax=Nocardia callitridis TaxID=648753 RepID=UPI0031E59071
MNRHDPADLEDGTGVAYRFSPTEDIEGTVATPNFHPQVRAQPGRRGKQWW